MSMLSAQCDELRRLANTLDTRYRYADDIATALREAADTILSLRDRAQDLQAENAKLRDGAYAMRQLYEDELKHALDENAKLRELLAKARDPQRIGGTADPESFVYAIEQLREFRWQHATNDEEAIPYINNVADAHERENAKLRDERDGWKKLCVDQEVMHFRREETLDNENTKQRELLLHMQTCMEHLEYPEFDCSKCPMDNSTGNCDFERRMRELEVTP